MDRPSNLQAKLQAVAALDEPTRRRLYEHVGAADVPVSRDDAAAALAIPRTTAAFHLDKLATEGLLTVVHERRTGRQGPGAGRPAKLYRRSDAEIELSLPERRYAVAGQLLAAAVEDAEQSGGSPGQALERRAHAYGASLARPDEPLTEILDRQGFEPRSDGPAVTFANCPFHALVQRHTKLICTMNLRLVEGLLEARGEPALQATLRPTPGHCCVRLEPRETAEKL
ncbi:putative transcriptional regulator [Kribbella flavida DSM 17836]|uniref:Putative transcriptional regulator n=1 Tax=Kribbella flavida (strain DSM 17836 / JCM 10339 / NBRC 14399) TaxID=479435 RepID=D2PXS1_KRIFD|nr:helix-turn-helix domain-containing protein [Kribbella flavida]ADB31713.1 putative transcriptional regulator [Kribbella flavida DSM 17836]